MSRSIAVRSIVFVASLLVSLAVLALLVSVARRTTGGSGGERAAAADRPVVDLATAVERTLAAGSARVDATYRPAHGPPVAITGTTSLVGPEAEVSAAVGGDPPAAVRVTRDGAWLRPPGADGWTPVPPTVIAGAATSRGWADVLRSLDASSHVRTDAAGRIVRLRLARDRQGGTLEVRLSGFGTEVVAVPP